MHSKQRVSTVRRAPTACSIALLRGELLLAVARALQKGRSWPEPTCGWRNLLNSLPKDRRISHHWPPEICERRL